jgi:hypothetical protein
MTFFGSLSIGKINGSRKCGDVASHLFAIGDGIEEHYV